MSLCLAHQEVSANPLQFAAASINYWSIHLYRDLHKNKDWIRRSRIRLKRMMTISGYSSFRLCMNWSLIIHIWIPEHPSTSVRGRLVCGLLFIFQILTWINRISSCNHLVPAPFWYHIVPIPQLVSGQCRPHAWHSLLYVVSCGLFVSLSAQASTLVFCLSVWLTDSVWIER